MMNKKNKKGFTLAELLIVVAIIAVLVAIAIPVFTGQLERSRQATDLANIRSAYATLVANYLDAPGSNTISVAAKKTQTWLSTVDPNLVTMVNGTKGTVSLPGGVTSGSNYYVNIDKAGTVTVTSTKP